MQQQLENIPPFSLEAEVDLLWDELQAEIGNVLRSGRFILGPNVQALEQEFAQYIGTKHAIGVNSGTDALVIALRALGIGLGDEVITSPFTFFATSESIDQVGATTVFADIDLSTLNLDPAAVEEKITANTKAILPVHLFGRGCDMEALNTLAAKHNLLVVEDVAQATGGQHASGRFGNLGAAGAFSFFPTKNLGGYGDGGMITTNDEQVAELSRKLRAHGSKIKYQNEILGYNSRLDELQAAIIRIKLRHLDAWNKNRQSIGQRYNQQLQTIEDIVVPDGDAAHVYHQYTIRCTRPDMRDTLREQLQKRGIQTMVYYPVPLHKLPIYAGTKGEFPTADTAAEQVLSLPIWPLMPIETQDRVIDAILDICKS